MANKVRWGILGAGRIAHTFAKDIAYCKNAKLIAVASRSEERTNPVQGRICSTSCLQ